MLSAFAFIVGQQGGTRFTVTPNAPALPFSVLVTRPWHTGRPIIDGRTLGGYLVASAKTHLSIMRIPPVEHKDSPGVPVRMFEANGLKWRVTQFPLKHQPYSFISASGRSKDGVFLVEGLTAGKPRDPEATAALAIIRSLRPVR